ncbi:MAG: ATP-binding protein [Streptosporangiaceae bacterium]
MLDVRRLVEGLRPPALDELGLAGACTQAVERLTAGTGLAVTVKTRGELPALPAAVEVAAYRVVVEAVTNTVRHAAARHAQVLLSHGQAVLTVAVTDDGAGLAVPPGRADGHGLAIMRERAEELGGSVTVQDASPGVAVEARLPAAAAVTPAVSAPAVSV